MMLGTPCSARLANIACPHGMMHSQQGNPLWRLDKMEAGGCRRSHLPNALSFKQVKLRQVLCEAKSADNRPSVRVVSESRVTASESADSDATPSDRSSDARPGLSAQSDSRAPPESASLDAPRGAPSEDASLQTAPAARPRSRLPFGFGLTRANELLVGRLAMLGFAASLLGEALTGRGTLAQLNLETGIPLYEAEPLLLGFVALNVLLAVGALGAGEEAGAGGRRLPEAIVPEVLRRGEGSKSWRALLGLEEEGPAIAFTRANELFVGRMAQLGFAASLIGEVVTGKGTLAQLNIETGVPVAELEPVVVLGVLLLLLAAISPRTGRFFSDENRE